MSNNPIVIESNIIIFLISVFLIIKLFYLNNKPNEMPDKYNLLKKVKLNFNG